MFSRNLAAGTNTDTEGMYDAEAAAQRSLHDAQMLSRTQTDDILSTYAKLLNEYLIGEEVDGEIHAENLSVILRHEKTFNKQEKTIAKHEKTIADQEKTIAKLQKDIKAKDKIISRLKNKDADLEGHAKEQPVLRKSKRNAAAANVDETKASVDAPVNKKVRVETSNLKLSKGEFTFATETYHFDRGRFMADDQDNGLTYLQDSVVTIKSGKLNSSMTKFSGDVLSTTPDVAGKDLDLLFYTLQDKGVAGPGFYEVDGYMFSYYISQQKKKLANGEEPGVEADGELGMKVIFCEKADRALAREAFLRAMP